MDTMKKVLSSIFFAVIVFSINISGQEVKVKGDYETTAAELTKSLSAKLNLSKEQESSIQNILVDYQKNLNGLNSEKKKDVSAALAEVDNKTEQQITAVFNEEQKISYKAFRDEWWKQIREKTHSMKSNEKEMKEEY